MNKNILLMVLGAFALVGIVISFLGDAKIIGFVVQSNDKCVNAMERFDDLKKDLECKKTVDNGADVEWCMKEDSMVYSKVYEDGSKEWGFIEGASAEKYIYNNSKKMCEQV